MDDRGCKSLDEYCTEDEEDEGSVIFEEDDSEVEGELFL
jgi:hypothetical protein